MDQDLTTMLKKCEVNEEEILLTTEYMPPMSTLRDKSMLEMNAPVVVAPAPKLRVGPKSSLVDCPYCKARVKTTVAFTTTTRTHILALLMSALCCICCACCTYCRDSARNSDHYCPNCTRFLGTYKK